LRQVDDVVFVSTVTTPAARRPGARSKQPRQLADGKAAVVPVFAAGEDPDTYVRKLGKALSKRLLNEAKPLSQFLLDELK